MAKYWVTLILIFGAISPVHASPQYRENSQGFDQLSSAERSQNFIIEYQLGQSFAKQQDYEAARTCFKRALLLCNEPRRSLEIQYATLLSYYKEQRFNELVEFFENHSLLYADASFIAYSDLLVILYHSYEQLGQLKKADSVLENIKKSHGDQALEIELSGAILRRDFDRVFDISNSLTQKDLINNLTSQFLKKRKSITSAKWMNAALPGLGYYYLGQKKSALISFTMNALLITGAVQLFINHYYTLGALTSLFELGWYAGGVFGAQKSAYLYNETLFSAYAEKIFYQESLSLQDKLSYDF